MIPASTPIYVFGCFRGRGHYLYAEDERRATPHLVSYAVERDCDPPTDGGPQIEGHCRAVPSIPGWSYLTWWDRQGDERHGSHTGVLAYGSWTAEELLEAGRARAPWAFRVEVVP